MYKTGHTKTLKQEQKSTIQARGKDILYVKTQLIFNKEAILLYKSNHNKKKGRRHVSTFYNNEYPIILSNEETISIFSKRNRKEFSQIEICRDNKNKSDIEIKMINSLATNSGKKSNDNRIYII
ncbi:MAG: hypothetical protein WCB31_05775 [Nitrososphaeraceae archaeon]